MDDVQTPVVIEPSTMTEDGVIALVEGVRLAGVKQLVAGGYPSCPEQRDHLKELLNGLDKSALTRKRIKADEGAAGAMKDASSLVAMMLTKLNGRPAPADIIDVEAGPPPVLGEDVPAPVLVPGELDSAPEALTYDTFMSRHSNSSSNSPVDGDDDD